MDIPSMDSSATINNDNNDNNKNKQESLKPIQMEHIDQAIADLYSSNHFEVISKSALHERLFLGAVLLEAKHVSSEELSFTRVKY